MYRLLVLVALLLSACGAPAAAVPPTPTLVALADVDLASLLVQAGDLPSEVTPGGAIDTSLGMYSELPRPQGEIGQNLTNNAKNAGFAVVFLYDSEVDRDVSYAQIASTMGDGKDDRNLGEQSWVSPMNFPAAKIQGGEVLFVRCHALAHVRILTVADVQPALAFARNLDKRLQATVC